MTIWSVFRNQILLWLRFKGGYFYFCLAATVPVRVHTNFLGVNRKPSPKSESEKYGDNYLYAIIKVRNYLRAIEILKSSSVPSPEVSFTYVPLLLVFQAKKTILPSVIECIKIFILSSGATVTSCDSKNFTFFSVPL